MSAPLGVHDRLGVRWSETPAGPLPRGYGDAAAEYRAALASAVVVDRCDRALVRLTGRDPQRILQGMLSNDVTVASAGRAVYAALLTAKARMVAELRVYRRPDGFLLEPAAEALPELLATFSRSVPPLFARHADASAELHVLGVYGPRAGELLAAVAGAPDLPTDEDASVTVRVDEAECVVVGTRIAGGAGFDVILPTVAAESLWQALVGAGAVPMGQAALDVLRIEAGVPRWGTELTPETIPLEAGIQARAISTRKGCYTGQEVITRILHRGHVNRLLRGVLLGDAASQGREAGLYEPGGKQLGGVTSSAWSPRLDQEIALAYVRREVEPGTTLRAGAADGPTARVVTLPFVS